MILGKIHCDLFELLLYFLFKENSGSEVTRDKCGFYGLSKIYILFSTNFEFVL